MENNSINPNTSKSLYDRSSEKELIRTWEDIKENNFESLNKSLLKTISEKEEPGAQPQYELYSKQMWDSKKGSWVPFSLWGAHFIVNERKEYLQLRIYRPCKFQSEFGPTIIGFQTLDSSYLNEKLKEHDIPDDKYKCFQSFAGYQAFYEIVKQDKREYAREGRMTEWPNENNRRIRI